VLSTFADIQLACSVGFAVGHGAPTVSLSLDFLEAVPVGSWIETRAEILRLGGQLGFAQCLIVVDGRPSVRANASFHLRRRREVAADDGLGVGAGAATRDT
jgi:acyl-coenzyme A thioesterase PaaI-like protein